jgi:uncharacterized iron-regulated membrane protein
MGCDDPHVLDDPRPYVRGWGIMNTTRRQGVVMSYESHDGRVGGLAADVKKSTDGARGVFFFGSFCKTWWDRRPG